VGAWGPGPFENDDASDWAWSFEGVDAATGLALIHSALATTADAELEAADAAVAVAAAQVVAWIVAGDPGEADDGSDAAAWISDASPTADEALRNEARGALNRVLEGSELADLRQEADAVDRDAWSRSLDAIAATLGPA
jgi:hypothetical protein